ncbi:cytochrome c oxidase assembly protein [Halalkalibacillus sediminis]|uniref:Cytochrome c oxidase assembly protein n=1 Tax=Halalkalibacillus sediminis TaxID=2018042 RepID=A0A2I0QVU9_9BACI|nr:SCO family protein [Halalkalibacillus sediminis]PKR78462.1 cytochrome c oxidase assembly protein [Halalkalibacillus sediminis]
MFLKNKSILILLLFGFILLLTACQESQAEEPKYQPEFENEVESFTYTNQDKQEVSLSDLEGTYWISNFIFTNCNTVCPPMTANMAKLQDKAEEENLDVRFVSFSVDPVNDDPATLKSFGDKFKVNYDNWDFLTGYDQEHIESFAANSFKALVSKVDGQEQVNHGTQFFIVNPDGEMINSFSGTSDEEMDNIIDHLKYYTD